MGLNAALSNGGRDRFEWVDAGRSSRGWEGGDGNFTTSEERKEAYYLEHCLPTIPQIVNRLREVREEYELGLNKSISETPVPPQRRPGSATTTQGYTLKSVYVLTNGWPRFLQELRAELMEDGWETVFGTSDLEETGEGSKEAKGIETQRKGGGLTKEEQGVSVAIDMGLAESAEVFVGNGVRLSLIYFFFLLPFEKHSHLPFPFSSPVFRRMSLCCAQLRGSRCCRTGCCDGPM
jgi:hypothetical protein